MKWASVILGKEGDKITEDDILSFINSEPRKFENSILEFKEIKNDKIDFEKISKEIVGFANAEGGLIILGLAQEEQENKEYAKKDGITPTTKYKKDNITNSLVTSGMNPIPPFKVSSVEIAKSGKGVIFLIDIDQGTTAYQAPDKAFYRRHDATLLKLNQQEILDILQRKRYPILDMEFIFGRPHAKEYNMKVIVKNVGGAVAKRPLIALFMSTEYDAILDSSSPIDRVVNPESKVAQFIFRPENFVIYPQLPEDIGTLKFRLKGDSDFKFKLFITAEDFPLQEVVLKIPQRHAANWCHMGNLGVPVTKTLKELKEKYSESD